MMVLVDLTDKKFSDELVRAGVAGIKPARVFIGVTPDLEIHTHVMQFPLAIANLESDEEVVIESEEELEAWADTQEFVAHDVRDLA